MKFAAYLVVALALGLLLRPDLNTETGVYRTSDGVACPLEGKATGSDGTKESNPLKNRFNFPKEDDIDPDVTLMAMLAPGDDVGRFDPKRAATITGFVGNVKPGGKESCNCKATQTIDMDTHVELALSQEASKIKTQRVIVEVTPRLRLLVKKQGIDWTTETLEKSTDTKGIKGKWITVTGWLFFDSIHAEESENINPGNSANWRATCWEIHPVTKIEILPGPPEGTPSLHPTVLATLQKAHVQQAKRDPVRQQRIKETLKTLLSKFNETDLKEKKEEVEEREK
jgi:hypothetical protein